MAFTVLDAPRRVSVLMPPTLALPPRTVLALWAWVRVVLVLWASSMTTFFARMLTSPPTSGPAWPAASTLLAVWR